MSEQQETQPNAQAQARRITALEAELQLVRERLQRGDAVMVALQTDLSENTAATQRIAADTSELVELMNATRGAFKVLGWIGSLAKPVTAILVLGSVVWGLWVDVRHPGGRNR